MYFGFKQKYFDEGGYSTRKMIGVLPRIVTEMEKKSLLQFSSPRGRVPVDGSLSIPRVSGSSCLRQAPIPRYFPFLLIYLFFFWVILQTKFGMSIIVLSSTRQLYSWSVALITITINYLSSFSLLYCEIIQRRDQIILVTSQVPNLKYNKISSLYLLITIVITRGNDDSSTCGSKVIPTLKNVLKPNDLLHSFSKLMIALIKLQQIFNCPIKDVDYLIFYENIKNLYYKGLMLYCL